MADAIASVSLMRILQIINLFGEPYRRRTYSLLIMSVSRKRRIFA